MWYAIRTGIGREEYVRRQINYGMADRFHGACRILYCVQKKRYQGQWHDKKERFLPGYLFWVTKDGDAGNGDQFLSILAREWPICPVKREEEEVLVRLTRGKNEIGMSHGVIQDGVLHICGGVLEGLESRVRKIDRHKRKGSIAISLHGRETMADIGLEITEKT